MRLCIAGNRLSVYLGSIFTRLPVTVTYIAKGDAIYSQEPSIRSFCGYTSSKLNFPLLRHSCWRSVIPIPSDNFKGCLIFQASLLDHNVENKHEHAASRPFNFRPYSSLSFSFSLCLSLSLSLFPFFVLYPLLLFRYKRQLSNGTIMSVVQGVFFGIVGE